MDPATLRAVFRAQGFVLLPSVFERPLMDELRVALDSARATEEQRFGLQALQDIGQDGYVSDLLAIGPSIEKLLDSEPVHELLATIFEEEAALYVGQGIVLDPGKGRGVWPRCWHADMFEVRSTLTDPNFCFGVNCLVIVDDITDENGPTAVLPGSQSLKTLGDIGEDDLKQMEFRAVAPSGSLLVLDGGVWHSASLNHSAGPRRVVKLLFTRRWIRPQIDYAAATVSGEAGSRMTPRVRRLLRMPAVSLGIGGNG